MSESQPFGGAPAADEAVQADPPRNGARARRTWDLVLTVVLLALLLPFDFLISYAGAFLAFASDSCTEQTCRTDQLGAGVMVALIGPSIVLLIGIVVAIVRLARNRLAFWTALVALGGMLGIWAIGAAIVFTSVS